eukprot:6467820-Amphidinium_carterae.1
MKRSSVLFARPSQAAKSCANLPHQTQDRPEHLKPQMQIVEQARRAKELLPLEACRNSTAAPNCQQVSRGLARLKDC